METSWVTFHLHSFPVRLLMLMSQGKPGSHVSKTSDSGSLHEFIQQSPQTHLSLPPAVRQSKEKTSEELSHRDFRVYLVQQMVLPQLI